MIAPWGQWWQHWQMATGDSHPEVSSAVSGGEWPKPAAFLPAAVAIPPVAQPLAGAWGFQASSLTFEWWFSISLVLLASLTHPIPFAIPAFITCFKPIPWISFLIEFFRVMFIFVAGQWQLDRYSSGIISVQFSGSVVSDPMNCSMPGLPVHHQLLESTQSHVQWVGDAIQPSHPLSSPFPPALNLSQHQSLYKWVTFASGGQRIGISASTSVLPMNTQDWSPFRWTGWSPCSLRDSQESSPTPQFKSINFLVLSFLYSLTLTSIHEHWKNHSLD